jgi:hypothetical protein
MAGKWLLIVPEPKVRKTACVVFEEADYSQHIPLVEILAEKLRHTMIE